MTSTLGLFKRLNGNHVHGSADQNAEAVSAERRPEQMIAGCEYELRQVQRDVMRTQTKPGSGDLATEPEPFVLGARLRSGAFRAALTKPHAAIISKIR